MAETFSIASLVDTARTYLAFRAGEFQLGARHLHFDPGAVGGLGLGAQSLAHCAPRGFSGSSLRTEQHSTHPRSPGALPTPVMVPAAGHRSRNNPDHPHERAARFAVGACRGRHQGHGRLATLLAAKACSAVAFLMASWLLVEWLDFFPGSPTIRLVILAGAVLLGWRVPDVVLSRLAARRRVRLEQGMPDALDLLVFCAEAGLSLDQAIEQVARDLHSSSPDVAGEFAAAAAEMRVLPDRSQALENLAQRAGLASLRSIVATLNQSIRFGTPLSDSLRVLAAEMRAERLARYEERAARLPVLLALPLMGFILPAMMIVVGAPLILQMIDFLQRAAGGSLGVGGKLIGVP